MSNAGGNASVLLWTAAQAAEAMQICERTLWELTKQGIVPCVRLGRRVLYSVEALRNFIQDQSKGGRNGQSRE